MCVCVRERKDREREKGGVSLWGGEGRGWVISAGFGLSFYNMIGCVRKER